MSPGPMDRQIRMGPVTPTDFQGGMDEMDRILDSTKPEVVSAAGTVYSDASRSLSASASVLQRQMANLEGVWKGDDADVAIEQMERLRKSADSMSEVADQAGRALTHYGEQLFWYKYTGRPGRGNFAGLTTGDAEVFAAGTMIAGPGGGMIAVGGKKLGEALGLIDNEEDKIAREHMNKLMGRTVEANDALPPKLTTDIPYGSVDERPPPPPPPPPPNPYDRGNQKVPDNPYGNTDLPKNPNAEQGVIKNPYGDQNVPQNPYGGGNVPGGGAPGGGGQYVPPNPYGGGGSGSDLAGLPGGGGVPGGGIGSDPFGRGGLGGGIGGGGAGGGIGGGAGGLGAGALGAGGMAGGMPGAGVGAGAGAGAGKGAGGARGGAGGARGGAGGMAGGGAPGGRGGGGQGEEEHERSTWLVEDEDIWGAGDDAAPPVIS